MLFPSLSRQFHVNWPRVAVYAYMVFESLEFSMLIYVVTLKMLQCMTYVATHYTDIIIFSSTDASDSPPDLTRAWKEPRYLDIQCVLYSSSVLTHGFGFFCHMR